MISHSFKNPLYFWNNYQDYMGLDYFQYAAILVAGECGCILAIFCGSFNARFLKTDQNIMIAYQFVGGISCFFYPMWFYFWGLSAGTSACIIWCCFWRFITGLSFAFITATTVKFVTGFIRKDTIVASTIAILHLSWPLATILNVGAGYVIEYESWEMVFEYTGIVLTLGSISLAIFLYYFPLKEVEIDADDASREHDREVQSAESETVQRDFSDPLNAEKIRALVTDFNSMLICFVSFQMTLRNRTIIIVTGSLWMEDTYGLSASATGWSTLSAIVGEVTALIFMHWAAQRYYLKYLAGGTLINMLAVGTLLFILSAIYGNNLTLGGALTLEAALTFGVELFYVVQQSNIIFYAPHGLRTSLLLMERGSQECGTIVAILATAVIWDELYSNGILVFSLVWIAGTLLMSFILYLYERERRWKAPELE